MVVVPGPVLQCQWLIKNDLHFFNVLPVPGVLQEPVGKAQAHDVEDRRFAKEMVHAVNMVFGDQLRQRGIERASRFGA